MKFKPTVFALLLAAQPFIGNMALAADEVAVTTEAPAQQQAQSSKLNINTATAEQFMALKGIGKKKAEAIISWRSAAKSAGRLCDSSGRSARSASSFGTS